MPPRDPQAILQKLEQTTLKIDSFFLRQTGFIANQTILKLGEYHLNCVPATISLQSAQFLAVLTPSEISLFSKYKEGTHTLILTFDNPDMRDIARYPLKVGILSIDPVPDRKNVCFLSLKLKSLPTEFVLFLGDYMEDLEGRLASWETLAAQPLEFSADLVLSAGLGLGTVLSWGDVRVSIEILRFQTKRIEFKVVEGELPSSPGPVQLRLVIQGRQLAIEGILEGQAFLPTFNPDWLDFVENAQFHWNMKNRNAGKKS